MTISLFTIVLAMAGAVVLGAFLTSVLRPRQGGPGAVDGQAALLSGQLTQLAHQQAAQQAALEARLNALAERVNDRLQKNAAEAGQSLAELRERLAVIDAAQKNITALSSQVVGLQDILSNKQSRGAFGEVQLQDIVQTIMAPGNYTFQATLGNGRRADCLLQLPNPPGAIAIDAKFPLEAYRAIHNAKDDVALAAARRDFSAAIRGHAKDIAARYIVPGETAEQALMFLPSEAVYAELHANFPNLVEEAGRLRVWTVSPTTLMATLTTIRAILKDVRMREQAHIIQAKVVELLRDVERLDERAEKLQRHFDMAAGDVRDIRVSTGKIVSRASNIEAVDLEEPAAIEAATALPKGGGAR